MQGEYTFCAENCIRNDRHRLPRFIEFSENSTNPAVVMTPVLLSILKSHWLSLAKEYRMRAFKPMSGSDARTLNTLVSVGASSGTDAAYASLSKRGALSFKSSTDTLMLHEP